MRARVCVCVDTIYIHVYTYDTKFLELKQNPQIEKKIQR